MIRDALQFLAELAKPRPVNERIHTETIDDTRYVLVNRGDELEVTASPVPPDPLSIELSSIDQIPPFVAGKPHASIWVGEHGVEVVVDDRPESYKRDRATVPLAYTPQWNIILGLRQKEFDQRGLVRLLRVDMAAAGTNSSDEMLKFARDMESTYFESTEGTVSKNRESLGTSIRAELVSRAGEIPDTVLFLVDVFTDPAVLCNQHVACRVELNPRERSVLLLPDVRELIGIEQQVRRSIGAYLEDAGVTQPVFYGSHRNCGA